MSKGVISGFCHQKKHVLLRNGNTKAVLLIIIYPLVLPWLCLMWEGKGKAMGSGGASADVHTVSWPRPQIEPAEDNVLQQKENIF